jgi:hypothetical protein
MKTGDSGEPSEPVVPPRHSRARPSANGATRAAGRKGGPTHKQRMLAFLKDNPGARNKAIAEGLGIQETYVHKIRSGAEKEDLVTRDGQGWKLTAKGQHEVEAAQA